MIPGATLFEAALSGLFLVALLVGLALVGMWLDTR